MMLQLEINGTFSSRENNFFYFGSPGNFIDFGDVLRECSTCRIIELELTYLSNKLIQERLTDTMTVGMPFQGMDLTE